MKRFTYIVFFICHWTICECKENSYVFKYKYISYAKEELLFFDTSRIKELLFEQLINNMSLNGIISDSETLINISADKSRFKDSVAIYPAGVAHLQLDSSEGAPVMIIIKKDRIIKIENIDTTCFYIDSSVHFYVTGEKKTINNFKCVEYISYSNDYKQISIWASKSIPIQIKPGLFSDIKEGIVEIDNREKGYKIQLMEYKKNDLCSFPSIHCIRNPQNAFKFIDAFN
jgi:hypothetical protein